VREWVDGEGVGDIITHSVREGWCVGIRIENIRNNLLGDFVVTTAILIKIITQLNGLLVHNNIRFGCLCVIGTHTQ